MNNIADIKTGEHTFEILHPKTDEPIGVRVTIMSPDDPRMKPIKRKVTDFNLQKQKRNKTLKAIEVEDNEISLVSGTMIGWEWYGDMDFNGVKPEFNPKNVSEVLKTIPWFKKQVNDELENEKDFF